MFKKDEAMNLLSYMIINKFIAFLDKENDFCKYVRKTLKKYKKK